MSLICDIVLDLVELYKDGGASPASAGFIESHLKRCPSCRRFYREYDRIAESGAGDFSLPEAAAVPESIRSEDELADRYSFVTRRLRRTEQLRQAFLAGIALAAAVMTILYLRRELKK